jgi:phosphate:Na+ symporter
MEHLAGFIAGIAFFFVGLKLFSAELNHATSPRFRNLIMQSTPNDFVAGVWGIFLSIFTAGNTFLTPCIAASFESIQAITFRKAIQIVIWSRVGSCFYIYLAGFNIKLLILFMLGIAGIAFAFNKSKKYAALASGVFFLGLVLFGIQLIKQNTKYLVMQPWFSSIMEYTSDYPIIAFAAGFLFLMGAQSLFGTLVISISFLESGLFDINQSLLFIYGSYLGEAVLKIFYLPAFHDVFKQIMAMLPITYALACLIGLTIYGLETLFQVPIITPFMSFFASNTKQELANANFFIHIITAIILSSSISFIQKGLKKFFAKEETDEDVVKPIKIPSHMLEDPLMTMELIKKEEKILITHFLTYMQYLRDRTSEKNPRTFQNLHKKLKNNLEGIKSIFSDMLRQSMRHPEICAALINNIEQQNLLMSLEDNLYKFSVLVDKLRSSSKDDPTMYSKLLNFVEALDAMLLSMLDVIKDPKDEFNINILKTISSGREGFMKKIRDVYASQLKTEQQIDLFSIINFFESNVWIIKKLANILEECEELETHLQEPDQSDETT